MSARKDFRVALGKRLLVLTRHRAGASFRQRVDAFLPALTDRGIRTETMELSANQFTRHRQWRRAGDFDGVWLHRKTLTAWDALALRGCVRRLIFDFDDAIMYQARTADRGPNRGRMSRFRRTIAMAHLVLAGNPYLAEHVAQVGGSAHIIPTGLDARRYAPKVDHALAGPLRLVWIGSRSTLKRLDPFRDMLSEVGRRVPGIVLRIIADAELHVADLAVENVPWSLESEGRLLAESDIGIAPLPDNPFTRGKCAFKVLQYMAAGLPVVTSPVGANAEYVADGGTGFHASGTEQWLQHIERLAADASLRQRLGRAGRGRVDAEFDVAVLGPRVADLIQGVLADP
jgi:glycosyltransferase involved in cell wall biosynthesis